MAAIEEIGNRWRESGAAAKAGLVVGVCVILAACFFAFAWIARDDHQVLFSDLEANDAAAIVAELDKMKVQYRLKDDGRTILVDKDAVYKTRLKVMGNGVLLRGNVGFEIFNTTDFGMTEFAQKINYQRALQGELARTIMGFDEVKFARVHLVMPESGLFKKNASKPKASVTLAMKNDARLSGAQVQGIQRLVAAAVPEIEPSAVTIVDQRGLALTRMSDAESQTGAVSSRLEVKKQMEDYFVRKIAHLLDGAFGPGQSIVSVDVTLDLDHMKVTREDLIPHGTKDGEPTGVVTRRRHAAQGVRAYQEDRPPADARRETPRTEPVSSTVEAEYQSGRVVEQVISMPGAIKRLSVGVLVPNNVEQARIVKIREMVSMAVGLDKSREDAIAVYSLDQFVSARGKEAVPAPEAAAAPPAERRSEPGPAAAPVTSAAWPPALRVGGLLLACVLVAFLARRVWQRRTRESAPLSSAERERVLAQVRSWLGSGGRPPTRGEQSP